MQRLRHRALRCRIVLMVLLAWGFALASGTANACMLVEPAAHRAQGTFSSEHYVDDKAPAAHDGGSHAAGTSDGAAHTPCKKFCDDETAGVTKYGQSASDGLLNLAVAPASWPLAHSPQAGEVVPPDLDESPRDGAPIPIRYLRLAL